MNVEVARLTLFSVARQEMDTEEDAWAATDAAIAVLRGRENLGEELSAEAIIAVLHTEMRMRSYVRPSV